MRRTCAQASVDSHTQRHALTHALSLSRTHERVVHGCHLPLSLTRKGACCFAVSESGAATTRAGVGAKETELPCFGVRLHRGAIVSVRLNCDEHTLTYALDGIWGPVFRDIPAGPFFAYLSLYTLQLRLAVGAFVILFLFCYGVFDLSHMGDSLQSQHRCFAAADGDIPVRFGSNGCGRTSRRCGRR